ncbi:hypothetical protein A5893_09520 [Pedobacter psychrophilus]|uniref:DUF4468 domain-containing protein n=1 Tax=Pedobacter psychrophilus TaxID=1826909 RepID=A0A179DFH8_9SPHI|nr:SRPBCC family protein [Pedobacter psychrophilus]OAQ39805.1 hypothetical protein A5893_09520 [Pedobacter psychrophilus]
MKNKITSILFIFFLLSSSSISFAQTEKFEKAEVENSIVFNADAQSVWIYLSDLSNLKNLVPSTIKESVTNGNGKGSTVSLTLVNGGKIVEKVSFFNNKRKKINYVMIETPLPIQNYLASFLVDDIGDKRVRVTFKAVFEVQSKNRKFRLDAFQNLQLELLENLKKLKSEK